MTSVFHLAVGCVCVALPVAAYFAIFRLARLYGESWRAAVVGAATCCGVFVAVSTEALGVAHLITRPGVAGAWLLLIVAIVIWSRAEHARVPREEFRPAESSAVPSSKPLGALDWVLLLCIPLLLLLVGITALLAAPNNWDAMAYHLSRVAEWMTNRDVSLYPAFYSAQLFLSPWAEYAMLHVDVLFGSDRFVNLVEWTSMVGSIICVSLIAKQLGAGRRGQLLAALVCATIPEGILEASGPMNTYAGALWIVVAVYYLLRWNQRQSWANALGAGAAMGLAMLTKGTAFTFLPLLGLACWWMGSTSARKKMLWRLPALALVILVLNGPLFVRNYRLSGSPLGFATPLGDDLQRQYENTQFSVRNTAANVVKNLALHVGTPSDSVNARLVKLIDGTLEKVGIDPNDPASTYRGGFNMNRASFYESTAGNPLQLILIVIAGVLLLGHGVENRRLRLLLLAVCGSFILFCALIRWQMWNSRYHLPLFVLCAAIVGVVLERRWPRWATLAVGCLLIATAFPYTLLNGLRTLAPWKATSILRRPRADMYFEDGHETLSGEYIAAANAVMATQCDQVGVDGSLEDFDYPLFVFLGAGHSDRYIRYTGVRNLTAEYVRPGTPAPCAVICLRCANARAKWAEYQSVGGRADVFGEIAVFSDHGKIANNQVMPELSPSNNDEMVRQIDEAVLELRSVNLAPVAAEVTKAGLDCPQKKADLVAMLDALYVERLSSWRIRDSVDPMRRKGEPIDHSKMDPLQLLAASEVLDSWQQELPRQAQELGEFAKQLDASSGRAATSEK